MLQVTYRKGAGITEVKVRGRFYYAEVYGSGWTLLAPKRRAAHAPGRRI